MKGKRQGDMSGNIKTINTREDGCYICGRNGYLELHHIFGAANRKHSTEDGLCVYLCRPCHNEPPNGVHFNKDRMKYLHQYGQMVFEADRRHEGATDEEAREMFMKRYGKNYL